MTLRHRFAGGALAALMLWAGGSGDRLVACGPFFSQLVFTNAVYPHNPDAYAIGSLGIVQPRYARRYLVQAYRRFAGIAPAGADVIPSTETASTVAVSRWLVAIQQVPSATQTRRPHALSRVERRTAEYAFFDNCGSDAFVVATETLKARVQQFGAASSGVRSWATAQEAVFANCEGDPATPLTLPEPASATLDPTLIADRAYQTAAAYFYATQYEKAEALFRAIAADGTSSWQPAGRYLATRALIRRALVSTADQAVARTLLSQADAELGAIVADPAQATMHGAARGLRRWVLVHLRPADRLAEAAKALATSPQPSAQDYTDYTVLMDRLVNENVIYDYAKVSEALIRGDDLTDWIVALQGRGGAGQARALAQWKSTQTLPWLVAALWRVDADSADATALLAAADAVKASSSAFATVSFLRVRLLIARGDRSSARIALQSLPDAPTPAFPADAINLVRSLRLSVAENLDEFLAAAPRMPVSTGGSFADAYGSDTNGPFALPAFDVDAAVTLTEQMPLSQLVDVVRSATLPQRLRLKVAIMAWTRAVELRDDTAGLAVAPLLQKLAPAVSPDLDRYVKATSADTRHVAGILTLLRWPGLRNYVPLAEEISVYRGTELRDDIALDAIGVNWWCGFTPRTYQPAGPYDWSKERPVTSLPDVSSTTTRSTAPGFLTAAAHVAASAEWMRLQTLGSAPTYLAAEAAAWAESRPRDPEVAEALARAVKATHYGCGDDKTGTSSQRAFALLHKLYPNSSWAKATPFWYNAR